MSPRKYRADRRAAARAETHRKLVEATAALHAEHGIVATTHAMVAQRADVSIPTVYNHFPTRGALVQACGAHLATLAPPMGPNLFDGKRSLRERVATLVHALFDAYAFWARWWLRILHEAAVVPELAAALEQRQAGRRQLLAKALGRTGNAQLALADALTDFSVWKTLVLDRGLPRGEAETLLVETIVHAARHGKESK